LPACLDALLNSLGCLGIEHACAQEGAQLPRGCLEIVLFQRGLAESFPAASRTAYLPHQERESTLPTPLLLARYSGFVPSLGPSVPEQRANDQGEEHPDAVANNGHEKQGHDQEQRNFHVTPEGAANANNTWP
jgi:hypothetical protein